MFHSRYLQLHGGISRSRPPSSCVLSLRGGILTPYRGFNFRPLRHQIFHRLANPFIVCEITFLLDF